MAELKGTQVAAIVVPFTDADKYATHDAEYGKGGFRSVETIALRDAIPTERKTKGMVVRVNETGLHYYWNGSAWTEWLPKGTMLVDATLSTSSTNPVQNKVITAKTQEIEATANSANAKADSALATANAAIPKSYIDTTFDDNALDTRVPSTKLLNTTATNISIAIQSVQDRAVEAYNIANAAIPKSKIDTGIDGNRDSA